MSRCVSYYSVQSLLTDSKQLLHIKIVIVCFTLELVRLDNLPPPHHPIVATHVATASPPNCRHTSCHRLTSQLLPHKLPPPHHPIIATQVATASPPNCCHTIIVAIISFIIILRGLLNFRETFLPPYLYETSYFYAKLLFETFFSIWVFILIFYIVLV